MKINMGAIKFAASRATIIIKDHAPEILAAVGVAGVVAGTVECCRSTKKAEPVKDQMEQDIKDIVESGSSGNDRKMALANVYFRGGLKIAKIYAPAVSLEMCGIACLLGAYGIMKKRNIALVGAYKTLSDIFSAYRERVVDEYGEDADFRFYHGIERSVDDENKEAIVLANDSNGISYSGYARIFDEFNSNWNRDPQINRFFLAQTQSWCNELLKARGHLFLNEVYDALGFDRTSAGAVVGWVLDNPDSDGFVDFGIYNVIDRNGNVDPSKSDFINAHAPSVYLDFNVDGIIYDLI